MTQRFLILTAAGGSFALLAGAFLFQALGFPPCEMCLWQRWPHAAAIVIGIVALLLAPLRRPLAWLGALAAAITGGLGVFHTGVERDWWEGPASCTGVGPGVTGLSGSDLLAVEGPRVVMCDQVSWELLGLSMASYNALVSFALAAIWVMAALRKS